MLPSTPSVAIVEDEDILREELAFQLGQLGFAAEAFDNATSLYRRLAVRKFDALVLDIGLDGEDGLSICNYLREHDKLTAIVFVTARVLHHDRLAGLQAGADAYLTKPIDLDELTMLLRRLIERNAVAPQQDRTQSHAALSNEWLIEPGQEFLRAPGNLRVRLTLNELRLLGVMMNKPKSPVGGQALALALGLMPDEYNKHRVEVIISRLREKVLRETGLTLPVRTRRGQGYVFHP